MYVKKNGHVTFRSNRRQNYKRNNNFANSKFRNKGNITQQYQKYIKLAKEASSSGDRIQSEYYYQFADHFSRLMLELGIVFDDNLTNQEYSDVKSFDQKVENEAKSNDENETTISDKKDDLNETTISDKKDDLNETTISDKKDDLSVEEENNDHESIQSVPFISQPIKKKSTKIKKEPI